MRLRKHWQIAGGILLTALVLSVTLAGCGGGGGGASGAMVTGIIRDADTQAGIGRVVVAIGTRSGVSTTPTGAFTVRGLPTSGRYQVIVQPSALFVPVPGPKVYVDAVVGQTVNVGTLLVIDPNHLPPGP